MNDLKRYNFIKEHLRGFEKKNIVRVKDILRADADYGFAAVIPQDNAFSTFCGSWGEKADTHEWFRFYADVPGASDGDIAVLELNSGASGWDATNPQMLLYENGTVKQGLDTNHTTAVIAARGKVRCDVCAYSGMQGGKPLGFNAAVYVLDAKIHALVGLMGVFCDILSYTEDETRTQSELSEILKKAVNMLDFCSPYSDGFYKSVQNARDCLSNALSTRDLPKVMCVGHTHIDVAWVWDKRQTREKALRSFATAAELMRVYPEYKFMSSQARLYKYVKEQSPALFDKIKTLVAAGSWEPEGAMWVEADCNLTGGEFLIRQILYGNKFFSEEFKKTGRVLWLPDVFGYSAALPQILKKCGIGLFVTSKISWNEYNRMPHDLFIWRGIDGSEIKTYFITTQNKEKGKPTANITNYNGVATPSEIYGTYARFSDKELSDTVLMPYGYGDGGGGTTGEMIETVRLLNNGAEGCCKTEFASVGDFAQRLDKNLKGKTLPVWAGELYLEFHRGTYTSVAKIKKNNRKSEFAFIAAEKLAVTTELFFGERYPQKEFDGFLETILTNQFHDILPGSSIGEVYDTADKEYTEVFAGLSAAADSVRLRIRDAIQTETDGIVVFNPNPFAVDGLVKTDGGNVFARGIPANGYKVVPARVCQSAVKASANALSNRFFDIKLDNDGNITRFYDKTAKRDVVKKGGAANRITAYEDLPYEYDNWELKSYYHQKPRPVKGCGSHKCVREASRCGITVVRTFSRSKIEQTVWLYDDIKRVDFDTVIDWRDEHIVLKAEFDTDINADKATFDIQFGCTERPAHENTPWDAAKFESCAHKFIDISEYGYGVSLLNDCKYGHSVRGGTLGLTLLKSGTAPYENADKGWHEFTYALCPHEGDYREAGIVRQAYLFNNPMTALPVKASPGAFGAAEFSLASAKQDNIFIETVKLAEDGSGYIARAYEAHNKTTDAEIGFGFDALAVYETDMTERRKTECEYDGKTLKCRFLPYEIKTFYLPRNRCDRR
jgi:alpha-mannosidase